MELTWKSAYSPDVLLVNKMQTAQPITWPHLSFPFVSYNTVIVIKTNFATTWLTPRFYFCTPRQCVGTTVIKENQALLESEGPYRLAWTLLHFRLSITLFLLVEMFSHNAQEQRTEIKLTDRAFAIASRFAFRWNNIGFYTATRRQKSLRQSNQLLLWITKYFNINYYSRK